MMEIDFYHYLSCLHWTPWYQEKLTNWDFPLCFLANILFYNYDQFSSSLMVTFYLCVDFLISSIINILYQLFNQHRMVKIFHDRNKVFQKKVNNFTIFSLIQVLFVWHMHIFMNIQLFDGLCYGGKCFVFYHEILCFQLINQINYQYHIIWNQI